MAAAADPPTGHATSEDSSNNNSDLNPVADLRPGLRSRPKNMNNLTLKDTARGYIDSTELHGFFHARNSAGSYMCGCLNL
jgi:hypothetical protein